MSAFGNVKNETIAKANIRRKMVKKESKNIKSTVFKRQETKDVINSILLVGLLIRKKLIAYNIFIEEQ